MTGSTLEPGTPEVLVNCVGGGPDGPIIDEDDNLWIACNQSNEILVLEPTQGRVIAELGDFGGIDRNGAPIGFLGRTASYSAWATFLSPTCRSILAGNRCFDFFRNRVEEKSFIPQDLRTTDGPWAHQVKAHTISKIQRRLPSISK